MLVKRCHIFQMLTVESPAFPLRIEPEFGKYVGVYCRGQGRVWGIRCPKGPSARISGFSVLKRFWYLDSSGWGV